jgi:hypothetical protein
VEFEFADDIAPLEPHPAALRRDHAAFKQCGAEHRFRTQVEKDNAAAKKDHVQARPPMDINRTRIIDSRPFGVFAKAWDAQR